jgi:hypothetical protein
MKRPRQSPRNQSIRPHTLNGTHLITSLGRRCQAYKTVYSGDRPLPIWALTEPQFHCDWELSKTPLPLDERGPE